MLKLSQYKGYMLEVSEWGTTKVLDMGTAEVLGRFGSKQAAQDWIDGCY
jgi:hypothetical protein